MHGGRVARREEERVARGGRKRRREERLRTVVEGGVRWPEAEE